MKCEKKRPGTPPSQMKNMLQLRADPTHLAHLSSRLSSPTLQRRATRMKIAQVIKAWRGCSLDQPRPADSVQTDVGAVNVKAGWKMTGDKGEQKMKKGPDEVAVTAEHVAPGKPMFY